MISEFASYAYAHVRKIHWHCSPAKKFFWYYLNEWKTGIPQYIPGTKKTLKF